MTAVSKLRELINQLTNDKNTNETPSVSMAPKYSNQASTDLNQDAQLPNSPHIQVMHEIQIALKQDNLTDMRNVLKLIHTTKTTKAYVYWITELIDYLQYNQQLNDVQTKMTEKFNQIPIDTTKLKKHIKHLFKKDLPQILTLGDELKPNEQRQLNENYSTFMEQFKAKSYQLKYYEYKTNNKDEAYPTEDQKDQAAINIIKTDVIQELFNIEIEFDLPSIKTNLEQSTTLTELVDWVTIWSWSMLNNAFQNARVDELLDNHAIATLSELKVMSRDDIGIKHHQRIETKVDEIPNLAYQKAKDLAMIDYNPFNNWIRVMRTDTVHYDLKHQNNDRLNITLDQEAYKLALIQSAPKTPSDMSNELTDSYWYNLVTSNHISSGYQLSWKPNETQYDVILPTIDLPTQVTNLYNAYYSMPEDEMQAANTEQSNETETKPSTDNE